MDLPQVAIQEHPDQALLFAVVLEQGGRALDIGVESWLAIIIRSDRDLVAERAPCGSQVERIWLSPLRFNPYRHDLHVRSPGSASEGDRGTGSR